MSRTEGIMKPQALTLQSAGLIMSGKGGGLDRNIFQGGRHDGSAYEERTQLSRAADYDLMGKPISVTRRCVLLRSKDCTAHRFHWLVALQIQDWNRLYMSLRRDSTLK